MSSTISSSGKFEQVLELDDLSIMNPILIQQRVKDIASLLAVHSILIEDDDEDIQGIFTRFEGPEEALPHVLSIKEEDLWNVQEDLFSGAGLLKKPVTRPFAFYSDPTRPDRFASRLLDTHRFEASWSAGENMHLLYDGMALQSIYLVATVSLLFVQ